ncbi:DUF6218 family protein [Amycolatopsis sp. FU40]|uniref:DUF6218 family protein n=1 Tax=Amycolatopsis sp. FU40 TaxID=2914159 RepID=UPI001F3EF320|nr:DUF6218 family protein [Amycolatopsis sp. FU40]UKD59503.1 DUF6218 family protein [Amycolatopsis sp. FU40]
MTDAVTDEAAASDAAAFQVPGTAVLAMGGGDDGAESLAVWHVSVAGALTGAWVAPVAEVFGARAAARRVLAFLERRAVAAVYPEKVPGWLEQLTGAADLPERNGWWKRQEFSPAEAFGEIVERRRRYADTVEEERARNKAITELEWVHELSDSVEIGCFEDLRRVAGVRPAVGNPVVSEALTIARTLRWVVSVWAETEKVKNRRRYVREAHGEAEPLPPSWLSAVQVASETRLPL